MDEFFDQFFKREEGHDQIETINECENESEEEGEIKDEYEIRDFDLEELEKICCSNVYNSTIDNMINDDGELKENFIKSSYFDDCLLENYDNKEINLNEIDEEDLLRIKNEIKDCFEMQKHRNHVESDSESGENDDDDDEDLDSIAEVDLSQPVGILNSLLASRSSKISRKETTRKGRIVDKETELEYLLPADLEAKLSSIVISVNAALEIIGTVIQRIDGTQTITIKAARSDPIVDLNTIVLDSNKLMIGMIDNIFGTKQEPLYLVVCKSESIAASFSGGEPLFCAPGVRDAYFTAAAAAGAAAGADIIDCRYDNDSDDIAFSDDEKEAAYRSRTATAKPPVTNSKRKSNRKRTNRGGIATMGANRGGAPFHQNRTSNRQHINPFGAAVRQQRFANYQGPVSYWQSPAANQMMMMSMPPPPMQPMPPMINGQYSQPAGQSFVNFPPPPIINPSDSQCTSFQQFQQQYFRGGNHRR